MKPLRILYTLQSGRMGGAEHSLYFLLKTLNREKFKPEVLFFEAGGELEEKLAKMDIPTRILGWNLKIQKTRWGRLTNPWALVQAGLLLKRTARAFREYLAGHYQEVDLIHTNSWLVNNIVLMARVHQPVIWNVRDLNRPRLTKSLVEQAARVVCVSEAVRALIDDSAGGNAKFRVIHNGIDCEQFAPDSQQRQEARKLMGLNAEHLVIGLFGRLTPLKGQAFFLEATAEYLKQNPAVKVVLVGESLFGSMDHRSYLEQLVLELGLASQVIFMGYQKEIPTLLNGLDVYVHPTTLRDAFPRATLEAMACAVPTLAASLGGIVEQINHGEDGLLFTPNDQTSLLAALQKLISEHGLRKQLGQQGRQSVLKQFPLETKTREMEKIYLEVAGS